VKAVNLLPAGQRRRQQSARPGSSRVVVAVLGALLLMAVVYVLSSNQVNDRRTQAAKARQEAGNLEARKAALGSFGDFAQTKQTRAAAVRQLAGSRFDWERLARELSRVIPRGSWLEKADASVVGPPEGSASGAASAASGGGEPGMNLVGCTARQSEVAKTMVRLSRVHRVADVSLNESKKGDPGQPPSPDSCGSYYTFDVSVTFTPEASPSEAPEGRKRVPVSLGGGP
jgi:hypothetical protein